MKNTTIYYTGSNNSFEQEVFVMEETKMKLYLVQHAKAMSKEENPERPLRELGRKELQKVADFVKPLSLAVDNIWDSGKLRATQTAEVLAGAFQRAQEQNSRDGLGPKDDVAALAKEITASGKNVMIVGHQPFLGKLTSLLLTGSQDGNPVVFKNAGIVCLNYGEEQAWQLQWEIIPDIIS